MPDPRDWIEPVQMPKHYPILVGSRGTTDPTGYRGDFIVCSCEAKNRAEASMLAEDRWMPAWHFPIHLDRLARREATEGTPEDMEDTGGHGYRVTPRVLAEGQMLGLRNEITRGRVSVDGVETTFGVSVLMSGDLSVEVTDPRKSAVVPLGDIVSAAITAIMEG